MKDRHEHYKERQTRIKETSIINNANKTDVDKEIMERLRRKTIMIIIKLASSQLSLSGWLVNERQQILTELICSFLTTTPKPYNEKIMCPYIYTSW